MDEATFENLVRVMAFPAQELAQMLGAESTSYSESLSFYVVVLCVILLSWFFANRCPADTDRVAGKFCATWLEQIDEVQAVAAQMMSSQSPQEHFDLMKRRLQTTAGGAALMGLQRISDPVNELEFSLQRNSMYSGVSGVINLVSQLVQRYRSVALGLYRLLL